MMNIHHFTKVVNKRNNNLMMSEVYTRKIKYQLIRRKRNVRYNFTMSLVLLFDSIKESSLLVLSELLWYWGSLVVEIVNTLNYNCKASNKTVYININKLKRFWFQVINMPCIYKKKSQILTFKMSGD